MFLKRKSNQTTVASRTSCFSAFVFSYLFLCTFSKLFINNQTKFTLFTPDIWIYFILEIDTFISDTYFRYIKFSIKCDYFKNNKQEVVFKKKKKMAEMWDGPIAFSAKRWCDHVVQRFLASYAIITALIHSVKLKRCIYRSFFDIWCHLP